MSNLTAIRLEPGKLIEARGKQRPVDVARAVGCSRQQLWNYENGEGTPPADILIRLCRLYGKPIEFFSNDPVLIEEIEKKQKNLPVSSV